MVVLGRILMIPYRSEPAVHSRTAPGWPCMGIGGFFPISFLAFARRVVSRPGVRVASVGLRRWLHRCFGNTGQSRHLEMGMRMWDSQIRLKLRSSNSS